MPEERVNPPEPPVVGPQEPKQREWVRLLLAGASIAILAAEVGFAIWYIGRCEQDPDTAVNVIKEFALIFLGPTVALVGATTGFYFGRS